MDSLSKMYFELSKSEASKWKVKSPEWRSC